LLAALVAAAASPAESAAISRRTNDFSVDVSNACAVAATTSGRPACCRQPTARPHDVAAPVDAARAGMHRDAALGIVHVNWRCSAPDPAGHVLDHACAGIPSRNRRMPR
jgi:hypothetical protein